MIRDRHILVDIYQTYGRKAMLDRLAYANQSEAYIKPLQRTSPYSLKPRPVLRPK
jgi:hypothetical protein